MHAYYDFSTSVQGVIHFRKSYLGAWLGSGKGVELLRCNGQPRVRGAAGVQLSASTRWQGLDHSLEGGTDSGGQFHHPQGCQPLGIMLNQTIQLLETCSGAQSSGLKGCGTPRLLHLYFLSLNLNPKNSSEVRFTGDALLKSHFKWILSIRSHLPCTAVRDSVRPLY